MHIIYNNYSYTENLSGSHIITIKELGFLSLMESSVIRSCSDAIHLLNGWECSKIIVSSEQGLNLT